MSQEAVDAGTVSVAAAPAAAAEASVALPSEGPKETLLAGKYKTPAELEKAYKELEKKLGAPKPEAAQAAEEKKEVKPLPKPEGIKEPDPAAAAAASAGLNLEALNTEYAEKGELSEASYEALAKVGIPKEMVNDYITGQEARAVAQVGKVHSVVGGEEQYKSLIGWAATNVPAEDIAAFNKSMATGDFAAQKMAVEALQGKYIKAVGSGAKVIVGDGASPTGAAGYESRAQMIEDMSDARYHKDPAFRAKVEAKLAKTTAF
jgi:hypothetical protein